MKPCMRNRWGKGTTCEKTPDTDASKIMKDRLALLQAERATQDMMWEQLPLTHTGEKCSDQQGSPSGTDQCAPSSQRKVAGNP